MSLHIIYEDEHLIVCYKPPGVPTQTAKLGAIDMVSLLKNYLYKKQTDKREPYVAVVHRLDQPVEGLLVFGKTPVAARELSKQIQGVGFGKYYKAVLCDVPQKSQGVLENYLVKDPKTNTSRVCEASVKEAKRAKLFYEVLSKENSSEFDKKWCLVRVKLETGRHHQIRVQMAHTGCPILGDSKYGLLDESCKQIALCAYRLEFIHPKTRKTMKFEIKPKSEGFQYFNA